jgi:hypothetical protein
VLVDLIVKLGFGDKDFSIRHLLHESLELDLVPWVIRERLLLHDPKILNLALKNHYLLLLMSEVFYEHGVGVSSDLGRELRLEPTDLAGDAITDFVAKPYIEALSIVLKVTPHHLKFKVMLLLNRSESLIQTSRLSLQAWFNCQHSVFIEGIKLLGYMSFDQRLHICCASRLFEGLSLSLMFQRLSKSLGKLLHLFLDVKEEVRNINLEQSLSFFDFGNPRYRCWKWDLGFTIWAL